MRICHQGPEQTQRAAKRGVSRGTGFLAASLIFLGLAISGCGGSSSGTTVPPPINAFTTVDAPGAGSEGTFALAINASGEIAGYFFDANNTIHGFVQDTSGTITTIDAPGARTQQELGTEAAAINGSGTVIGYFVDTAGIEHSFIRTSDGTLTTYDPPGSIGSATVCINDAGAAAGGYIDANGAHGFIRESDGTFTDFDIPGISASEVEIVVPGQINSDGTVAGYYEDSNLVSHGFLRSSSGSITVLDAPNAGTAANTGTEILDLNSSGAMVGVLTTNPAGGTSAVHSFLLSAGGTYTAFDPPDAASSLADGINDSGAITGYYLDANSVRHGYLRNADGSFVTFDAPEAAQLPVSSTNLDTIPRRINASGLIAGLFSDSAGTRHGFVRQ